MGSPHYHCQFKTNRNPQFGVQWRRKLSSVQNRPVVIQHSCEAALGPGPSPARQPCCTPRWSALHCAGLLCSAPVRHLECFSSAWESWFLVVGRKGKCAPRARGELAYMGRSPCSWLLIGLSSCSWELQILTVWLVQKALSLFFFLNNAIYFSIRRKLQKFTEIHKRIPKKMDIIQWPCKGYFILNSFL